MASWTGTAGIVGTSAALVAGVALALVAAGQAGAFAGKPPPDLGVHQGRLKPPSATRNSVSSQAQQYPGEAAQYARIDPLRFDGAAGEAMARLQGIVVSMPGAHLVESGPDYTYVQFSTRWLGFVDDAEFFATPATGQIELRSASRLGSEDFGVNRKRIEAIRARFEARITHP